jgi:hypothetical protein
LRQRPALRASIPSCWGAFRGRMPGWQNPKRNKSFAGSLRGNAFGGPSRFSARVTAALWLSVAPMESTGVQRICTDATRRYWAAGTLVIGPPFSGLRIGPQKWHYLLGAALGGTSRPYCVCRATSLEPPNCRPYRQKVGTRRAPSPTGDPTTEVECSTYILVPFGPSFATGS